jgi:hypothetical protein
MKISKFTKLAISAAFLVSASIGANASIFNLGTIQTGVPKSLVAFGGGSQFASFNDTFNFTLAAGTASSGYSIEAFDFDFGFINAKTTFTNISLFNTNGTITTVDDTLVSQVTSAGSKALAFGNVATGTGSYYLNVAGTIDAGGTGYLYNGSISSSTISPVPEPETYAVLLAGLGLMGAIARRRNKA